MFKRKRSHSKPREKLSSHQKSSAKYKKTHSKLPLDFKAKLKNKTSEKMKTGRFARKPLLGASSQKSLFSENFHAGAPDEKSQIITQTPMKEASNTLKKRISNRKGSIGRKGTTGSREKPRKSRHPRSMALNVGRVTSGDRKGLSKAQSQMAFEEKDLALFH